MSGELASVNKVLNNSEKPFTAIMGGAKVSDKILILEQLIGKADNIIIGGGMAFTFVSEKEQNKFNSIEQLIGTTVPKAQVPEQFGPTPEYAPRSKRSGGGGRKGRHFHQQKRNNNGQQHRGGHGHRPSSGKGS